MACQFAFEQDAPYVFAFVGDAMEDVPRLPMVLDIVLWDVSREVLDSLKLMVETFDLRRRFSL